MTVRPTEVWDPGLQPERTALAWRRVAVTLLGLALAAPKVAWPAIGGWGLLPSALVAASAVGILSGTHVRYHRTTAHLTGLDTEHSTDGRLPMLTLVTTLILAGLALAVVAFHPLT